MKVHLTKVFRDPGFDEKFNVSDIPTPFLEENEDSSSSDNGLDDG